MKLKFVIMSAFMFALIGSKSEAGVSYIVKENPGVNLEKELAEVGIKPKEIIKLTSDKYEIKDVDKHEAPLLESLKGKAIQRIELESNFW